MDPQDDSGKQKKKKQRVFQFLDDDVIVLNASRPSSLKRASSSSSTAHEEIVLVDDVSPVSSAANPEPPLPAASAVDSTIAPSSSQQHHPLEQQAPSASSSLSPAPLPPTPSSQPPADFLKTFLRQYECSICFEPMACAVSLVPCGDTFCYACIAEFVDAQKDKDKERKCPHCQAPGVDLSRAVPNRLVEDSVRGLLTQMQDPSVLKDWEARADEGLQRRKRAMGGEKGVDKEKKGKAVGVAGSGFPTSSSNSSSSSSRGGRDPIPVRVMLQGDGLDEVLEVRPSFPFIDNRAAPVHRIIPAASFQGRAAMMAPPVAPRQSSALDSDRALLRSLNSPDMFMQAMHDNIIHNRAYMGHVLKSKEKKKPAEAPQVVDLTDSQTYESVFL